MTMLDLFAGAGGMTLGFKDAGIRSIGAIEIDRFAVETFRHNFPGVPTYKRDIHGFKTGEIKKLFGGVDIIAGGPPCQGFSVAGPSQYGVIDERNTLIMEFFRFVQVRPTHRCCDRHRHTRSCCRETQTTANHQHSVLSEAEEVRLFRHS